mgnify:CR=1 FL=1
MTYFSYLPNTTYTVNSKTNIVKDILKRSSFISEHKPYSDLYDDYVIKESDSITSLALDYYGSQNYYWVISVFNEIHDVIGEWPMSQLELDNYLDEKYGAVKNYVRHYIDTETGDIIGEVATPASYAIPSNPGVYGNLRYMPVSFAEYESIINEDKRYIKLLRKELLSEFVSQFSESFNV